MGDIHDHFWLPVDEDAYGFGGRGKFSANVQSGGGGDGARGFIVEIETQGIGAEFFGETGVLCAGDAADFDKRGHWLPRRAERAAAGAGASIRPVPMRKAS